MSGIPGDNGAASLWGRPLRLVARDILLFVLGVPLFLAALFAPWDTRFRVLSFVAGIVAVGVGIYAGRREEVRRRRDPTRTE